MRNKKWYLTLVLIIIFYLFAVIYFALMVYPKRIDASDSSSQKIETLDHSEYWVSKGILRYTPTHEQIVWRYVLEWCESRGQGLDAINPKDKDGTPSYYHYQFKPETLKYYAVKYQLLSNDLERIDYLNWSGDWELTSEILNRMINDKSVVWTQEFPDCVRRNGFPPR